MAVVADQVERHPPAAPAQLAPVLIVAVVIAAAVGVIVGQAPVAAALAPVVLLPAAVVDLRTFRLPNRLVGFGAVTVGLSGLIEVLVGDRLDRVSVTSVLVGSALLAGPLLAVHLIAPAAMGFGDVKLAVVLGAALGLHDPLSALVALLIACGIGTLAGLAGGRSVIPFGPALIIGAATALAIGEGVIR